MTGRGSQRKGASGERELSRILSAMFGVECRRGASPYLPGVTAPDVYGLPGVHIEAKRRERVSLPAALRQAKQDAPSSAVAIVTHRSNRQSWIVSVELADLPRLARAVGAVASDTARGAESRAAGILLTGHTRTLSSERKENE